MDPATTMDTDDDGSLDCPHCGGSGTFMACFDDLCIGQGYCIHGDGEEICAACNGSGELADAGS